MVGYLINDRWSRIPEEAVFKQLNRLGIRNWHSKPIYIGGRPRHYLFGGPYAYPYSLPLPTIDRLSERLNRRMTWYKEYNSQAMAHFNEHGIALNQAAEYWEQAGDETLPRPDVNPITLLSGTEYIAVIGLFHLSGIENGNNHHLYIDLIDPDGNRIYDPSFPLQWGWEEMTQDLASLSPVRVDKPDSEPGANIGLHWGQVVFGFTLDNFPADTFSNIHIRYGNDGPGNDQGHHSHYVVLQKRLYTSNSPDLPPPSPADIIAKGLVTLEIDKEFLDSLSVDEQGKVKLIVPIYR